MSDRMTFSETSSRPREGGDPGPHALRVAALGPAFAGARDFCLRVSANG